MTEMDKRPEQASATAALLELLDRDAIARVVNDWGLFRDTGRWEQLRRLFAAGAVMQTTWFAGSAEEFVERSSKRASGSQHFMAAPTIDIRGDRAIAETRMMLLIRAAVDGVPVDVTSYGRFHDRIVREQGDWRILARTPIYEKDRIDVLSPGRLLELDEARLAQYAEGYRHVAYVQSLRGAALTPGLATAGSAEEATLCADGLAWLSQGLDGPSPAMRPNGDLSATSR